MKVTGFESDYAVATLRRTLWCEQALALEKWALVGKGLMAQRPFDSWESRFVKIWTICNLQNEHDMAVTGRDRHDPRKAILRLVFYTKTKLYKYSLWKARVYIYIHKWYIQYIYIYIHDMHYMLRHIPHCPKLWSYFFSVQFLEMPGQRLGTCAVAVLCPGLWGSSIGKCMKPQENHRKTIGKWRFTLW